MRTSELRYRRLFESAQDGILILDGETGEIIDANPFLLDLLNFTFREVIGLKLWEIGQFKDIAANKEAFQQLQDNQYIRYEDLPLVARGGKHIQVEFVSNVYLVDNKKIIQCNIRDISARAKVQEASRMHLTALELANKSKDEFLAALSHELRTPLSAISSMLDVLELQHDLANMSDLQTPSELDNSGLALIRRNIHILVSLINELLDLTHISRGDLHLELATIDAHHAIGDALRDVSAELKAKQIDLRVNLRAEFRHIKVDRAKFHRIITNLAGNAIKFTPVEGKIRVTTTSASNDDLVMEISDSGMGIEAGSLARIFPLSSKAMLPSAGASAAWVWDSPSPRAWPKPMAPPSKRKVKGWTTARRSGCDSRPRSYFRGKQGLNPGRPVRGRHGTSCWWKITPIPASACSVSWNLEATRFAPRAMRKAPSN